METETKSDINSSLKRMSDDNKTDDKQSATHSTTTTTTIATSNKKGEKNRSGGNGGGPHFRTPQQCLYKKKMWNKRQQKSHQINSKQSINKADVENLPNIKNQLNHHHKIGGKLVSHRLGSTISGNVQVTRSKFFLLDKPPRKEVIIPPTKFLLGGNISDPLNLNSLQDEANNSNTTTPSTTPIRSPITTPPKVEVIIPPNIHDPLHLLDPVDSVEYEKQLVSPMKRKTKNRHRKNRKPKRRRLNSLNLSTDGRKSEEQIKNVVPRFGGSTEESKTVSEGKNDIGSYEQFNSNDNIQIKNSSANSTINNSLCSSNAGGLSENDTTKENDDNNSERPESRRNTNEKKELKLNLIGEDYKVGGTNNKKRKSSEGPTNVKIKFRRMDSMDKIVSPVVPQPGAWKKRPPRPTGARKSTRRSTSVSETELISPSEESKLIETEVRVDTPELDTIKEGEPLNLSNQSSKNVELDRENQQIVQNTSQQISVTTEEVKKPKFKPENVKYQYGNYDRYSGYRNLNEFMDVRLQVFQRNAELFRRKDCLDIGCNVGHMTIAIGKKLQPKSILGIDLDPNMISRARHNVSMFVPIPTNEDKKKDVIENVIQYDEKQLKQDNAYNDEISQSDERCNEEKSQICNHDDQKHEVKLQQTGEIPLGGIKNIVDTADKVTNKKASKRQKRRHRNRNKLKKRKKWQHRKIKNKQKHQQPQQSHQEQEKRFFPISFPISFGGIPSIPQITAQPVPSPSETKIEEFPKNVYFRQMNYVLKDESLLNNDTQQYDLIICLSVTKWIHLNFGDNGLKIAFKRMFNQLRPGGKLILEAQNWASYKKKKNLTETIYNNYHSIEFFPNKFHEYLLSNEVGFSHSYTLGVPRHLSKGFCRPIQLYAKGDFTPNHIRWSDTYHPQTPYEPYRGCYASAIPRSYYPLWGRSYWSGSTPTPRGAGSFSCRQTPMYNPGSQYYNPLETDSYLPSYDTEILNCHVFASPLYQTVWSPPASLRNSSQHTPVFGSVRDADIEEGAPKRHVYPPNEESNSPQITSSAFNSIREAEFYDDTNNVRHVYASAMISGDSSSPRDEIIINNDGADSNESVV